MDRDYFYVEASKPGVPDPWGLTPAEPPIELNRELIDALRRSSDDTYSDVAIGAQLLRIAHEEFTGYGTSGVHSISNDDSYSLVRAIQAVLDRAGFPEFKLPFRDFSEFEAHWKRAGAADGGGYDKRRRMIDALLNPWREALEKEERMAMSSTLSVAISPHGQTGWGPVDAAVTDLRRHFKQATTGGDYSNVGNSAVRVLELLSENLYDHEVHGEPGSSEPPVDKSKARLDAYISKSLVGPAEAELRSLTRAAIAFAQKVKHNRDGDRRNAGLAADSVIMVANFLRRVDSSIDR